jgi:Raf kinase inhibitor-like YbhB/YbcL family protein
MRTRTPSIASQRRRNRTHYGLALACALAFACEAKHEDGVNKDSNLPTLSVKSSAFLNEGSIPSRFTCDGDDASPPLAWNGAPASTQSFAIIMDDPDAPARTWVHWLAWNITGAQLSEGVAKEASLDSGMRQGLNSWSRTGYGGPCPPSGTHRYYFKVYALDRTLDLAPKTDAKALAAAMAGHVVAQGELMGKYSRKR